ncbi:hypothetical protein [Burkholderia contaminans]|uniref:hypothetical protein n=1 Tax=Burkholderia contaminans TaxID=488447 RepID=UPI00115F827F|nr:hypothetical protein [Burkholderia contaminans]
MQKDRPPAQQSGDSGLRCLGAAAGFLRALPRLNRGNDCNSACYDRRGIAVVDVVVAVVVVVSARPRDWMRKPVRAR